MYNIMHKVILSYEASLVCCVPGPQSICILPVMNLWTVWKFHHSVNSPTVDVPRSKDVTLSQGIHLARIPA